MSQIDIEEAFKQLVLSAQKAHQYTVGDCITFNQDIVNALRVQDLTQAIDQLIISLQGDSPLTLQQSLTILQFFPG